MAYSYVWPTTLPENPQKGFSETGGVLVLRTPMDAGPAKMRRRGAKPQVLAVSFIMTTEQVGILDTFIKDTIRGTARFGFKHPRLGTMVEVRIVPGNEGAMFTSNYAAPGYWSVSLQLEILP